MNSSKPLAAKKMTYINKTQELIIFETESPTVRIYSQIGSDIECFKIFNPLISIQKKLRAPKGFKSYAMKKFEYVSRFQEKFDKGSKEKQSPDVYHSKVFCVAFVIRTSQYVFCTADGYVCFYNNKLDRLLNYEFCEDPQIGMIRYGFCYKNPVIDLIVQSLFTIFFLLAVVRVWTALCLGQSAGLTMILGYVVFF
jgi:hypothetical protein